MKSRIGLLGWYGHGNIGDDALLCSIHDSIKKIPNVNVVVIADNPLRITELFQFISIFTIPFSIRGCLKANFRLIGIIRQWAALDVIVLGGGGFFADDVSIKNIIKWSLYIVVARILGVHVIAYCLGIGPLKSPFSHLLTKISFSLLHTIIVRDHESFKWLQKTKLNRNVIVAVDPVFSFTNDTDTNIHNLFERENITFRKPYVVISIPPYFHDTNRWPGQEAKWETYCRSWAQVVDVIVDNGTIPLFVPMQHCIKEGALYSDVAFAERIISMSVQTNKAIIIRLPLTPGQVFSIMSQAELVFGMRLHALILGAIAGTAIAGAMYHHKVSEVVNKLQLNPYFIDVSDVNENTLIDIYTSAWRDRDLIKKSIIRSMENIKCESLETESLLISSICNACLLEGKSK